MMDEVEKFTKEVLSFLPDYEIVTDHKPSFVIMLAKKKFFKEGKWNTWIDFKKYDELVNSGKEFGTEDYLALTPKI